MANGTISKPLNSDVNSKLSSSFLQFFNAPASGTNLNTLAGNGIQVYQIGDIRNYGNAPSNKGTTGMLIVFRASGYIMQQWYSNTSATFRFSYDNTSTWTSWM